MGLLIDLLRRNIESLSNKNKFLLRIGGFLITFTLILISGTSGWIIEQASFSKVPILNISGSIILIVLLASTIAYRSLRQSVLAILNCLPEQPSNQDLEKARKKLSHIVGRDVNHLDKNEILRATAESASENSVDGIFAPMFWMAIGIIFWSLSTKLPGPLTLALCFKASSTIDSMIGYKKGDLIWLGYAGAKLDDLLTWIPCRIVLLTLPFVSRRFYLIPKYIKEALVDGKNDESPNSGYSEAIFAHCFQIKMGGKNIYQGELIEKSILAINAPIANKFSIKRMLNGILYLELIWVLIIVILNYLITIQFNQ